jgi:DUF1009 family protein
VKKLIVISGSGIYPELVVRGAKASGVSRVDVLSVRGSTSRATKKAADNVHEIGIGEIAAGIRRVASQNYDGAILAGQINPLSLFRSRFDDEVKGWLRSLPCKNAHTVFGKLIEEFEKVGVKILPATSYMEDCLPGAGVLTSRIPDSREQKDIDHAAAVVRDMGRHDVGQTVLVKEGMVLAVEAFEGTNAAILRGGKLGGKGAVIFKGAREGHDMRFDVPVIGMKTLKTMKRAGVTALAFQAGRQIVLEKEAVIAFADKHNIALVGIKTDLPSAPIRPDLQEASS